MLHTIRTASHLPLSPVPPRPVEGLITFNTLMSTYREALANIPCILSLAAPTLKTLKLAIDWPSSEVFFPSHLPALVSLQITQPWAHWHLRSEEINQLGLCPSLCHLMIDGFAFVDDDPAAIISSIRRSAPSLKTLHLPLTAQLVLGHTLKILMDEPVPPEDAVFPRTLECLILHGEQPAGRNVMWGSSSHYCRSVVHVGLNCIGATNGSMPSMAEMVLEQYQLQLAWLMYLK
jgi:hypothetical protein